MPGRIRKETVEKVRDATDIVELVSSYVQLKRAGKSHKGLCPFHDEKTGSFFVTADMGRYKCFGCGETGDVFDFMMAMDRVEFVEAVEILAERAGIAVEREERDERPREGPAKKDFHELNERARRFFVKQLGSPGGEACRAYLEKRGISARAIEDFGIGYAPASWDGLTGAARRQGVTEALMVEAGLAKKRENTDGVYDAFRDRLIFPIRDSLGRVIGFGGRSLDGSEPKYLNSPETPVFSKRRSLYGLDRLRGLRDGEPLLVMEGYTDVIMAAQQAGAYAVATLGTALTEEHARLVSKYSSQIVLVYDGDSAGRKAAERGAELFTSVDLDLRIALLPSGQDPCDFFLDRGADGLGELLERTVGFYEFVLNEVRERHDLDDVTGRVRAADELIDLARSAKNPVKRDVLLERIAADLGINRRELERRLVEREGPRRHPAAQPSRQDQEPEGPADEVPELSSGEEDRERVPDTKAARSARKEILEALLNGADPAGAPWGDLRPDDYAPGPARRLFQLLLERADKGLGLSHTAILVDCDDAGLRRLVNGLVRDEGEERDHAGILVGAVAYLLQQRRTLEIEQLGRGVDESNFEDFVRRLREAKLGGEQQRPRLPEKDSGRAFEMPRQRPQKETPPAPVEEPWELEDHADREEEAGEEDPDFF